MKKKIQVLFSIMMLTLMLSMYFTVTTEAGSNYKRAYRNVIKSFCIREPESTYSDNRFALIYIDKDKIPELVCDRYGYRMEIYTYKKGKAYCLTYSKYKYGTFTDILYSWPYGMGGNAGYYYLPKKNSVFNENGDSGPISCVSHSFYKINRKNRLSLSKYHRYMLDETKIIPRYPQYKRIEGIMSKRQILKKLR